MKFCIIGAGIVGLTTALELQNEFGASANVTIFADKFGADTTSSVAAGIFRPGTSFSGPTESITQQWINDAYTYWNQLLMNDVQSVAGLKRMPVYAFSNSDLNLVKNHFLEKLLPVYRSATDDELMEYSSGKWTYGWHYETLLIDFNRFNQWATQKVLTGNGCIQQRRIESIEHLNELSNNFDVFINCTGLGARQLFNDRRLVPIRGQVLKVRAPWVQAALYGDSDAYIIPGFNGTVTLGGTRQYDDWNLNENRWDTERIREQCINLLPNIRSAEHIRTLVGLRPHRDCVRVDGEIIGNRQIKIVHNYGHGGFGVTTSPGTAKYAVQCVRQLLCKSGCKL